MKKAAYSTTEITASIRSSSFPHNFSKIILLQPLYLTSQLI